MLRGARTTLWAGLCAGLAVLLSPLVCAEEPSESPEQPVCVKCHADSFAGMSLTKHAVKSDFRTPWGTGKECQACHGDATEHLKNPVKNPIPQRFLKETPAAEKSAV